VYRAGARIERHVLAEHDRHLPVLEGVLQLQSLERTPLELRQHPSVRQAEALEGRSRSSAATISPRRSPPVPACAST